MPTKASWPVISAIAACTSTSNCPLHESGDAAAGGGSVAAAACARGAPPPVFALLRCFGAIAGGPLPPGARAPLLRAGVRGSLNQEKLRITAGTRLYMDVISTSARVFIRMSVIKYGSLVRPPRVCVCLLLYISTLYMRLCMCVTEHAYVCIVLYVYAYLCKCMVRLCLCTCMVR